MYKIVIGGNFHFQIQVFIRDSLFYSLSLPSTLPSGLDEFFSPEFQTIWYRCEEEDTRRRRRRGRARFHARIPRTSYWIVFEPRVDA